MMDLQNLSDARRYALYLIAQVIVIVICFGIIKVKYTENVAPDQSVAETFALTKCTIVAEQLKSKDTMFGMTYRADFQVAYTANGVAVQSASAANGLDYSYTSDQGSQNEFLNEFVAGSQYPCWYDPANPQTVVLVLRHDWVSAFPLFIPCIIMVIMFIYVLGTLTRLVELYMAEWREKNGKKR